MLSYNVFLRAPTWMFWDGHDARAAQMPAYLLERDFVVVQEAFSLKHADMLFESVKASYPYRTNPLGENEWLSHNGGVFIFSRHPLDNEQMIVFRDCEGPDCMVKKGAVYARATTEHGVIHIIGTHLQAEHEFVAQRRSQISELGKFIKALGVPASEPLLIAGDFNVDYFTDDVDGDFSFLLSELNAGFPNDDVRPSYDAESNSMLDDPYSERLDYVFFSRAHLAPDR